MERKLLLLYVLAFTIALNACTSYKNVPYYQNLDHTRVSEEAITNYTPLRIQTGDVLGITVTSLNENQTNTNAEFNPNAKSSGGGQDNLGSGYRVDAEGNIHVPYAGTLKVAGLTPDEVGHDLSNNLESYFKKPIVNVRILNFKISVFGDVLRPDVYTIQNQHVNVNEALSMAGDLNITAKRTNVLLIRESAGKRQYIPIDLTRKDIFDSPYYYLKNNDIIYVEPDKTKYATVDTGYRTTSLVITAITAAASIIVSLLLLRKY